LDSGATITPGLYGLINLAIVVYDVAPRIGGGTNVYMGVGSPYSVLYFDKPMDIGERIAHELRKGVKSGILDKMLS